MIRNDTENGGLICRVGIAPSTPAEFPIFRIHQKRLPLGGHTPRHTHRGTAGSRCGRPPPWVARPPLVADVASCLSNAASPRRTGPRSDRSRRVQHPSQRIDAGPGGRLPASHGAAAVPSQARGPARRRAAARGAGNTRGARRATRAHGEKRLTSRSHRPEAQSHAALVGPKAEPLWASPLSSGGAGRGEVRGGHRLRRRLRAAGDGSFRTPRPRRSNESASAGGRRHRPRRKRVAGERTQYRWHSGGPGKRAARRTRASGGRGRAASEASA